MLGLLCFRCGRRIEGLDLVRRSVLADPDNPDFHANHAMLLGTAGRFDEAIAATRRAIGLRPDHADFYNNLGVTYEKLGQFDEAVQAFKKAVDLNSSHPGYRTHFGNALRKAGQLDAAESAYREALELDANYAPALQNLAVVIQDQSRHDEAIMARRRAINASPHDAGLHSSLLYMLHYPAGFDAQTIFHEHLAWAKQHEAPLCSTLLAAPRENDRSPKRRLRVGYVSPDFRRHSTATFIEPVISHHDREQFEIALYSSTLRPDDFTDRFRGKADLWREIISLRDYQAAELIRQDQIDILVDVTGHMGANRLLVFARRPAPIQVTYIGHPNTTGMTSMNYRLTDAILDPPDCGSDQYQAEMLIRLPRVVDCYQPPREEIPVAPPPADRNGYITFGCLNNPAKITERAIALWCQILRQVPDSRLLLLGPPGVRHIDSLFAAGGISADRISRLGHLTRPKYLTTFNDIDIALDCFPYNGHTTSCDGFWMGVPLVTLTGNSYVSRMGVSLLTNLGLPEWIARTPEEYVSLAVRMVQFQVVPKIGTLWYHRTSHREDICRGRFGETPFD